MPVKQTTKRKLHNARARVRKRVKLAVVPHKANQYRPHAIRRYGILAVVALVLVIQGVYNGMHGNVLGAEAQVTPQGLLVATNKQRQHNGQPPLTMNADLAKAAKLKAQNMFDEQYWAHTAPDGTTPWHWFGAVGYTYSDAGENLAKNFATNDSTVTAWMASPSHRANILNSNYQDVGFAIMDSTLDGEPTTLVVALYGTPDTSSVQGAATTEVSDMNGPMSLMARMGVAMQSLSPAAISSIVLLLFAAVIAMLAHTYRHKLPRGLRMSWYRHHGMYKAVGFTSLAIIIVVAYGGVGQI